MRLVTVHSRTLAAEVEALREVAIAATPFLQVNEHASYYIGTITGDDVRRLREALAALNKEKPDAIPS